MKFFRLEADTSSRYTGDLSRAAHRWGLPGVEPCPTCGVGGGWAGIQYPCADLSELLQAELKQLSDPWPVAFKDFVKLRERVRPHAPEGAVLEPGTRLGPLVGAASGAFGPLSLQDWTPVARADALAAMQEAGLRGLIGGPVEVTFRARNAPVLRELQLELHGRLHEACFPHPRRGPCGTCGSEDAQALPAAYWLARESLPAHLDLFRLRDFPTLVIVTERMVEVTGRLKLDGVTFRPLETR
ncbi:double-CXXCG motif protein [Comamonas sp. JC664]|uniref:SitI6 family double-CXXCG motif immunity protein n=1 Tax=Comamonas sp. JC664 TaxID=2801917 RepID=UPI00174CA5E0|nr:double-CXXCG motif protein [Comamonas sp. JC664]MBL0697423.1 hypothetical protein [Comamonas sp. JC664]GHG67635.1 hypothetical protein GCM10012319_10110 [Comamonas sp. KCTC 72670]